MTTPEILNNQGREMLLGEAEQMRAEVINFAKNAISLYIGIDFTNNRVVNEDQPVEYFVLADLLDSPEYESRMMLSLRLEDPSLSSNDLESLSSPKDSLTILYPVPHEFDLANDESGPNDIPDSDTVYFVKEVNGEKSYFAVVREVAYHYLPTEVRLSPEYELSMFDNLSGLTVQSGMPALATLLEDLINMKGVVQRRVVPGKFMTIEE